MSIHISNLSYNVTEVALKTVFAPYGTIIKVQLPVDDETGCIRGFAFIDMESEAEEKAAIEVLNGAEWMGRTLKVNQAKPQKRYRVSSLGSEYRNDRFSKADNFHK
ncbi:RNA-binding protein [Acaryochloris sp. CCMEE 5410]|uniref:RNA recognition motif domain-containing protein n=1 Tax=Acaryochloris sp. CCMEE 5410 TaxID=310037 RepID=UPI0002483863|nr:RNA-binding protein [Acaryochloris sp. CCMEE 5410]KAI9129036.1 RNA-binding protein [Acaryochloris sp. CCMEE 5410]